MDIPYTTTPRQDTGLYNAKVGIWLFLASEVMLFGAFFSSYIVLRVGSTAWPTGLLNVPIGCFNTVVLIASSWTVIMSWASLKMGRFDRFKIFQALTVLCALTFLGVKTYEYREKFIHYQVWMKDGKTMTGHIEGAGMFMNLAKFQAQGKTNLVIHPDVKHGRAAKLEAKAEAAQAKHDGAAEAKHEGAAAAKAEEHATTEPHATNIDLSQVKRISAYVPSHGTYFAIYFTMTALHGLHVLGGAIVMAYFLGPGSKMYRTDPERFTNRIEVSGLFWHFVDLVWIFLFPVLYLL